MKKISNWVFGSFFRTMGRFFFFLFFGFLLATILSKSEIKWTDLLGIETIKADSYLRSYDTVWYDDQNLTQIWTPGTTYQYKTFIASTGLNSDFVGYNIYSSNKVNLDDVKGGHLTVPFVVDTLTETSSNWSNFTLNNAVCSAYKPLTSGGYYCEQWDDISTANFSNPLSYQTKVYINMYVRYTSGYVDNCEIDYDKNYFYCPIINSDGLIFDGLTFAIKGYNEYNQSAYRLGLGLKFNVWSNDSYSTQQAIENQTNQTISTITDTNTTEASSEANNFFESFTSQDNGGISSIITAPLSAISGLASATCTPITLPIPYLDNKQLVLPCMSAIYTEHFGAFFSLYQTIIFGVIAYRMLVSIFMMIQGFKNPDDDKIEVVDL